MSPTLEQVLADTRGEAAVLRANGAAFAIDRVEAICDAISEAAGDYMRWLSIGDARLKSGLSVRTLRRRFPELLDCGLARMNARHEMEFRACSVPQRAAVEAQRERGRKSA